jgi:hypothetical protein
MSVLGAIGGAIRGLLIAAATAGAAFGALVIFEPFGKAPAPAPAATSTAPASLALQARIEEMRLSLRETEDAIESARTELLTVDVSPDADLRAQYEAKIAAATERRDLALRHADAIRKSLDAGVTPSSLAAIRDSVVVGQLLGQQAALDAQIAVESARLRANHPTMLALNAQRNALVTQVRQEAANIASALESEARIDDAQIELLESQLPSMVAEPASAPDIAGLEIRAATQRAELDSMVDAYFNIPPAATSETPTVASSNPPSVANLAVIGIAALAALVFQILLAARRRRAARAAADMAAWRTDEDSEIAVVQQAEPRRKAA